MARKGVSKSATAVTRRGRLACARPPIVPLVRSLVVVETIVRSEEKGKLVVCCMLTCKQMHEDSRLGLCLCSRQSSYARVPPLAGFMRRQQWASERVWSARANGSKRAARERASLTQPSPSPFAPTLNVQTTPARLLGSLPS